MRSNLSELARRLFHLSGWQPRRPPRLRIEPLEERTVPAVAVPTVSVEKITDAGEAGSIGVFRFTRAGDLSEPLTVTFTAGGTATAGTDYHFEGAGVTFDQTARTGSVTIPVGSATADLEVTPDADNEFETTETVLVAVTDPPDGGNSYLPDGAGQQVDLTDDPPCVTGTTNWQAAAGGEVGRVTLTRSGGDISQPLMAWFEPAGTFTDSDGQAVPAVTAVTAEFAPGTTELVIPIIADAANGGFENVQMPGAMPAARRQDQSVLLAFMLQGQVGNGTAFAAAIDPSRLPNPLTYREYLLLQSVAAGDNAARFGSPADAATAIRAATDRLRGALIDWGTVPDPRFVTGASVATFAGAISALGWPQTDAQLQGLLRDLGSDDFGTRDAAERDIKAMILGALARGDMATAALAYDQVLAALQASNDTDYRIRVSRILDAVGGQLGRTAFTLGQILTALDPILGDYR